jgi:hypothetical protein
MRTARNTGCVATESRRSTGRGSHGTTSDGLGERRVRLSDDKVTGARVEYSAVLVFRSIVLNIVSVLVSTSRLRLGIIEVLLVE